MLYDTDYDFFRRAIDDLHYRFGRFLHEP
jgi:hypothetical protein